MGLIYHFSFAAPSAVPAEDPTGMAVLITGCEFAGEKGVRLGRATDTPDLWAVSAHSSNRILNLRFDKEFRVLLNSGQEPGNN